MVLNVRANCLRREKKRIREEKEEEGRRKKKKRRKSKGMELCMEIDFAWYGNFGKDACLEILLESTCLSWVRKTLTLQYMCVLVGLS